MVDRNATDAKKKNLLKIRKESLYILFVKNNSNSFSIFQTFQKKMCFILLMSKQTLGIGYAIIAKISIFDSDRSVTDVRSLRIIFISKLFN